MDFAFTEEQAELKRQARAWLSERYPLDREWPDQDKHRPEDDRWSELAELGWPGVSGSGDEGAPRDPNAGRAPGARKTPRGGKERGGAAPNQTGGLGGQGQPRYWLALPVGLLLRGALALFMLSRYLRPHTAGEVWRRLGVLSRLAGVEGPPGETPTEFGRRLSAAYPEAARPIRELTDSFVVVAYAPPEAAGRQTAQVVERWELIRPHLVRRVFERVRPAW